MSIIYLKVRGSSLIEVVVALALISISITLTVLLFSNVFNSSQRVLRQHAWYILTETKHHIELYKDVHPDEYELDHYIIKKNTFNIDKEKGVWIIELEALDFNYNLLANRRFLMEVSGEIEK